MKLKLALVTLALLAVLAVAAVPARAVPVNIGILNWYGSQFQWRAWAPSSGWSSTIDYSWTESDAPFTLTANTLHTEFTFSPEVTELKGASTDYVYNKKSDLWIQREGTIDYKWVEGYGDVPVRTYWRGYIKFSGDPSQSTFERSIVYQWVYVCLPHEDTSVLTKCPYAIWDEKMGAWLVGFSVYVYDEDAAYACPGSGYSVEFPAPFPEPVPASNYNPLDL